MSNSAESPRPDEFAESPKAGFGAVDPFSDYRFIDNRTLSKMTATADDASAAWTIALDLRMTFSDELEQQRPEHFIRGTLEDLKGLAEATEGTDVKFVVQAQHRSQDPAVEPAGTPNTDNEVVDRYVIADGAVTALGSFYSEGMDEDTEAILRLANEVAPSENLGLIVYAHGDGMDGLAVENDFRGSTMSVEQLNDAIRQGLAGSPHEKLDLLAFDACSMGASGVLDELEESASHIVASEEYVVESRGNFDMINLAAVLENVLENPDMTPGELAGQFISAAQEGANGTPVVDPENGPTPYSGTPTLAHFDMSQFPDFEMALNDFGVSLDEAMRDEESKRAIMTIIRSTATANGDRNDGDRDLLSFVNLIESAIADGKLNDPEGQISRSAEQLVSELHQLRPAYYGDPGRGMYDTMGGLSVAFPPSSHVPKGQDYFEFAWANHGA